MNHPSEYRNRSELSAARHPFSVHNLSGCQELYKGMPPREFANHYSVAAKAELQHSSLLISLLVVAEAIDKKEFPASEMSLDRAA